MIVLLEWLKNVMVRFRDSYFWIHHQPKALTFVEKYKQAQKNTWLKLILPCKPVKT